MPCYRHLRTRDRRFILVILLASGKLKSDDEFSAVLEGEASVGLVFRWPTMLLILLVLVDSVISFCLDIDKTVGIYLA